MDTKGLQKEFINWCKANKKSPKSELETKLLFVSFMKEKHPEEYKAAVENQKKQQLQQAQKAAHGAKLNYFKSLKNQCAEDEEVIYYKKGGSVTCGCKKKEQGGEVPTAKCGSAVEKFKAARKMQKAGKMITKPEKKEIKEGWDKKGNYIVSKKGIKEREEQLKNNKNEEGQADPNKNKKQTTTPIKTIKSPKISKKGGEIKKNCGGSSVVKAFKAAKCGGKVKKHQEGGWILSGYANPYIDVTERVINPNNKYQWVRRTIQSNPELPNDTVYKTGSKSGFPKDQNSLKGLFNKYYIEDPEWNKKQNMALFLQKIIKTKLKGDKLMNGYIPRVK